MNFCNRVQRQQCPIQEPVFPTDFSFEQSAVLPFKGFHFPELQRPRARSAKPRSRSQVFLGNFVTKGAAFVPSRSKRGISVGQEASPGIRRRAGKQRLSGCHSLPPWAVASR
ncbi:hypothetical protein KM043_015895 [Ampulex compressa]|nr:hypothetical protein KM043_015895 [Ampulex compressa]